MKPLVGGRNIWYPSDIGMKGGTVRTFHKLIALLTFACTLPGFANPDNTIIKTIYLSPSGVPTLTLPYFTDSQLDLRDRTYCYQSDMYDACRALANDIHSIRLDYAEGAETNVLLKSCAIKGITVRARILLISEEGPAPAEKSITIPPCSGI